MKLISALAGVIILAAFQFVPAAGSAMHLKVGDKAPKFTLTDAKGDTVRLSDYAGKKYVVLVFYPGDETSGCTKQLSAIRDDFAKFEAKNAAILGINPGDTSAHRRFAEHHGFQFPLLVDDHRKTAKAYGCSGGPVVTRTVFVVDPRGIIVFAKRGLPTDATILDAIPTLAEPAK